MKRLLWIALATAVVALATLNTAGCSTETTPGTDCVGGVIDEVTGNCEPKCDPAKCLAGNVCVANECRLLCTAHSECFPAVQDCTPTVADDSDHKVQVCLENGRQPAIEPISGYPVGHYGMPCILGGDADCNFQHACPNGLECTLAPTCTCELDVEACGDKALCNIGKCAEDGARCVFNTCEASLCTPNYCQKAGGDGDANAYCTHNDCSDDSGCPSGYGCAIRRDPHDICGPSCAAGMCSDSGATCTSDAGCQKGNNSFCGPSVDPCIDPGTFAQNGASYFEGSNCLLRRGCVKRSACMPCSHNLDCSLGDARACAAHAGSSVCAAFCDPLAADCRIDEVCLVYGGVAGATQTCTNAPTIDCVTPATDCPDPNDTCTPRYVCVPQSGACDGSDAPNQAAPFCYHCLNDEDCGSVGTSWACRNVAQNTPSCFDNSFPDVCTSDADCPVSPGGRNGKCLDESVGYDATSSVYHRCFFPFDAINQQFTCF